MSVLLTGGAGYIGCHMALELLSAGEQVVVLDDLSTGFGWALPPEANQIIGDYGDVTILSNILVHYKIDTIIHLAAKTIVPNSITDPLGYYETNSIKSFSLLNQAKKFNIPHFIFASSAAVYGDPKLPTVKEGNPTNPINPYGRSKLMVEWMIEDVAQAHKINFVTLRFFNVCGADPYGRAGQNSRNATHLINVAVQAALGKRKLVNVYGTDYQTPDGSCVRDYIHVTDLVRASMAALKHLRNGYPSITCNIGNGHGFSVLEVIGAVKRVSGSNFDVRFSGRRAGDPAIIIASNKLARRKLDWLPLHTDLEEIIRHTFKWECHLNDLKSSTI